MSTPTRRRATCYAYGYQVSTLIGGAALLTMSTLTRCRTTYYEYTYEVARHLL